MYSYSAEGYLNEGVYKIYPRSLSGRFKDTNQHPFDAASLRLISCVCMIEMLLVKVTTYSMKCSMLALALYTFFKSFTVCECIQDATQKGV